jgi:hypothetical protein
MADVKPLVWMHGEVKTPPFSTDAVVILEVFPKKTAATPKTVVDNARNRIKQYRTI